MSETICVTEMQRGPITHELKTWESYFHALADGTKTFEIRRDDRDFRPGDTLRLRETYYHNNEYTGRELCKLVTYVLRMEPEFGLMDGFAVLALQDESALPSKVLKADMQDKGE